MKIVLFYHSLVSDWNHGNAHFLRGVATELIKGGHEVAVYEPRDAWSVTNLVAEQGEAPIQEFRARYPLLRSQTYDLATLDLDRALQGADLVVVHEWNDHALVRRVGEHRARTGGYRLFFHDTHHRAVTAPQEMAGYDLSNYDGVLAYGNVLRDLYLQRGWTQRAWTWHEAADTNVFSPAAAGAGGRRPRVDRQLGRRGTRGGTARVSHRTHRRARAARAGVRRALSEGGTRPVE